MLFVSAPIETLTASKPKPRKERYGINKALDEYIQLCAEEEVIAEKQIVEADSIENGIITLISQKVIKRLVMGAAANDRYERNMMQLKSEKAKYVQSHADDSCHIWFVCNGNLIYTSERAVGVGGYDYEIGECSTPTNTNERILPCTSSSTVMDITRGGGKSIFGLSILNEEYFIYFYPSRLLAKELAGVYYDEQYLEELYDQYTFLQKKIEKSNLMVEKYKKERNELKLQRDNALLIIEFLEKGLELHVGPADFTYLEIREATDNFHLSRKIGEDGFTVTYKGVLHHAEVVIKVPTSNCVHARQEFLKEVHFMSKLRHPNIVTLIGVSNEESALIYEYLPNGNLEDRLACKDNTPPLSWQARIRIASELCYVLMFLHSEPEIIIHGDLKPSKILLDANLSCKLSEFGIKLIFNGERFYTINQEDTSAYMDPEFLSTGELTANSDIFAFGIILLRLLTGKSEYGIVKEVQRDLNNVDAIFDPLAGDWPFDVAKKLVYLGLWCCAPRGENRANLKINVWSVVEPMRMRCLSESSSSSNLGRDEFDDCPPHFLCPITKEVMQDPHVASDGFTYEEKAIKIWFDHEHDTSPMTGLKLASLSLVPNRALRSAIQGWPQRRTQ